MNDDVIRQAHAERVREAMAMGGERKLRQRRADGVLNARERVDLLMDAGSFRETGLFASGSADGPILPADGKVCGTGLVDGRRAAVIAYDFTVKGASSSQVSNRKMQQIKSMGASHGMPVVYLAESTGVRMPDVMGGAGMGAMSDRTRFLRRRESPWAAGIFGNSFGSAAWHSVSSDFAVIRKGAVMAVSSPGLVSRATGQVVDREELGGWRLHTEVTGLADAAAETDEEAIELIRRFLSYLPSHNMAPPPVAACGPDLVPDPDQIPRIVPEARNRVYDVRKVIDAVVDQGSQFELKSRYAKNLVTSLARISGRTVGIVASNPISKGGAIDAKACDKATGFLVLCDSYNVPVVFLVDQPGFLIGVEAERDKIAGKVVNWMNALSLMTVPKITVMMRKNFGQAYVNMGAPTPPTWWQPGGGAS